MRIFRGWIPASSIALYTLLMLSFRVCTAAGPPEQGNRLAELPVPLLTMETIERILFPQVDKHVYDLELQSHLSTRLVAHPDWRRSKSELRRAVSNINIAKSVQRIQINASADAAYRDELSSDPGGTPTTPAQSRSTGAQLRARKLLYDFEASNLKIASAEAGIQEARERQKQSQSELLLTILSGLLTRQKLLFQSLWYSSMVETQVQVSALAKERLELGAGTIYELSRAKTSLTNAELRFARIANDLKNMDEALGRIGIAKDVTLGLDVRPLLGVQKNDALEDMLLGLPVILQITRRIEGLEAEVKSILRESNPKVFLDTQASARKYLQSNPEASASMNYSFSLVLEYAVADGGLNRGNVSAVMAELDEAKAERELALLSVSDEVNAIQNQSSLLNAQLPKLRETMRQSGVSYTAMVERFRSLRGGIEQVDQAGQELNSSVEQLIESYFEQRVLEFNYLHKINSLIPLVLPSALPFNL